MKGGRQQRVETSSDRSGADTQDNIHHKVEWAELLANSSSLPDVNVSLRLMQEATGRRI